MRRACRLDRNQPEIVAALEAAGCSVQSLAPMGDGVPDLLVGVDGVNWLLEVKDGEKPLGKRQLTDDEKHWHHVWLGQVCVVTSIDEALAAVGITARKRGTR